MGSWEVVEYPREVVGYLGEWGRSNGSGSRGMSWDVAGQPGRERKASGRCEVPRGLRDITVCRMMSCDVGKGLDSKRDEQETSCTAGDELCRGR